MAQQKASVLSLFGDDLPYQVMQQRNEEDMKFAMQASGNRGGLDALTAYSGRQLGHAAGQLFGAQDPELERATKIQAVTRQIQQSGVDPSDPDAVFPAMIQGLQQAGLTKEAMLAAQEYQSIKGDLAKQNNETTTANARMMSAEAAMLKAQQEKDPRIKNNLEYTAAAIAVGIQPKRFMEEHTQEEVNAMNAWLKQNKKEIAAAGADRSTYDQRKDFDKLGEIADRHRKETEPYDKAIVQLDRAAIAINNATSNAYAFAAMKQELAGAFGDAQKAQAEVNAMANAGSLPKRYAQKLNSVFNGTATELTVAEARELVNAVAKAAIVNREAIDKRYLSRSDLPQQDMQFVVRPRPQYSGFNTGSLTIRGKSYKLGDTVVSVDGKKTGKVVEVDGELRIQAVK